MKLAVIPARGGSKRIPRKNVRPFAGKPMIAWPIETIRSSGLFDLVIVSTDDDEIAEIARAAGAETPFRRPAGLADDHTTTRSVINHAINEVSRSHGRPTEVCCVYPTAAFLRAEDLSTAATLVSAADVDFAFSVTSFPHPIQRALKVSENQRTTMFWPEHANTRSQDLEAAYHDAGQFYFGTAEAFLGETEIFSSRSAAVVLPRFRVHDIDTEEDWHRAEIVFEALGFDRPEAPADQKL